jgi:multidrug resistance efflux pump
MVLRAPANGKIVRSFVTEGTTFGVQTRMPAFLLQPEGALIVRAEIDQEWASRVAAGQEASIQDDGNSNLRWKGKVTRVCDSFLPKRPNGSAPESLALSETKVLECIVSIDDVDPKAPPRVGQRVKVGIGID